MESRTLLDRQATGEISERQADDIHESQMSRLETDFIIGNIQERENTALTYLQGSQPYSSPSRSR